MAIAEGGRNGEVRYLGEIENTEAAMSKLVKKLAAQHRRLTFCYEAGPTGYGLHRRQGNSRCRFVADQTIDARA